MTADAPLDTLSIEELRRRLIDAEESLRAVKATEKRQALLMHELDHRVKNTLAMVLSICSRTLSGSDGLDDFRVRFTRRIQALAATHNLLADASWTGIDLSEMIRAELAPYISASGPRMEIAELDRSVAPDVAIAFGLVIHELATNAVKYGALSAQSGCVTVSGRPLDGHLYEVAWTESGGPPVEVPRCHGFGQTLITRSLARGGGTGATVAFAPDGIVCRIVLPIEGCA
ncbi:MAG: sensor histidine kinase [Novosphingobium sp.]